MISAAKLRNRIWKINMNKKFLRDDREDTTENVKNNIANILDNWQSSERFLVYQENANCNWKEIRSFMRRHGYECEFLTIAPYNGIVKHIGLIIKW